MNVVKRNMKVTGAIIHDKFVRFVGGGLSRPDMMIEFLWVTDAMNSIVHADRIYQVI